MTKRKLWSCWDVTLGMFKDRIEVSGLDDEKAKLDDILQQMRGGG